MNYASDRTRSDRSDVVFMKQPHFVSLFVVLRRGSRINTYHRIIISHVGIRVKGTALYCSQGKECNLLKLKEAVKNLEEGKLRERRIG